MYALPPQPEVLQWGTLPFFLNIPCKVIWQFWGLFSTLMYSAPPAQWIIIQVRLITLLGLNTEFNKITIEPPLHPYLPRCAPCLSYPGQQARRGLAQLWIHHPSHPEQVV